MRPKCLIKGFGSGRRAGAMLTVALLLSATSLLAAEPPAESPGNDPWGACGKAIASAERAFDIPPKLLFSIAHTESARRNEADNSYKPWPWTVMAKGTGRHYATKADAIDAVQGLKDEGVGNIDVGCMQVNLGYHPHAFDDLGDAFDPESNATYAARFLSDLFRTSGSWPNAVARYHSSTYRQNRQYKIRVLTVWRQLGGSLR